MSVFVVAVLMAGLGYYWGLQRRGGGGIAPEGRWWWLALAVIVYLGMLLVPFTGIAMGECIGKSARLVASCTAHKRAAVAVFLIVSAGLLTFPVAAWLAGHRRAWWLPLVLWPAPFLAAFALIQT